jgi:hypothetical protein
MIINDFWDVKLQSRVVSQPRFFGAHLLHWQGINNLRTIYHEYIISEHTIIRLALTMETLCVFCQLGPDFVYNFKLRSIWLDDYLNHRLNKWRAEFWPTDLHCGLL